VTMNPYGVECFGLVWYCVSVLK